MFISHIVQQPIIVPLSHLFHLFKLLSLVPCSSLLFICLSEYISFASWLDSYLWYSFNSSGLTLEPLGRLNLTSFYLFEDSCPISELLDSNKTYMLGVGKELSKLNNVISGEETLVSFFLGRVPASEDPMMVGDSGVSPPKYIPGILCFVIKAVI